MYINGEEVFARYPILRTWGMLPKQVDTDLIPYAEAEMNGLLAPAFAVPITNGSSSFTIKDLAIEFTYCKALFTKDPKQWESRHKALTDRVNGIVSGKEIVSDVGSGGILSGAIECWSTTMGYPPVHTMLDAEDSRIDPYMKRDELAERSLPGDDDI